MDIIDWCNQRPWMGRRFERYFNDIMLANDIINGRRYYNVSRMSAKRRAIVDAAVAQRIFMNCW